MGEILFVRQLTRACVLCLLAAPVIRAQSIGTLDLQECDRVKVQDGLVVTWSVVSTSPESYQVQIFDQKGRVLVRIPVLRSVPEAKGVSVYDVAARPGAVAVAAVYSKEDGTIPAGALLLYDISGNLRSSFALAPSRGILRLALDEHLNVWTLTATAGDKEPSDVPVVVEYGANGATKNEVLTRDAFPLHAAVTEETPTTGSVEFGYDAGTVWFWLPGTTDLVTIGATSGSVTRTKTDLPSKEGSVAVPRRVLRDNTGKLIAEITHTRDGIRPEPSYYSWAPDTHRWILLKSPEHCSNHTLIGTSGGRFVFFGPADSRSHDICVDDVLGR